MKLNPEDLDVMSFDTGADLARPNLGAVNAALLLAPYNPMDPTPASRCFVCD